MACVSTRAVTGPAVSLGEAVQQGLAPDGGLYVPVDLDATPPLDVAALRHGSLADAAAALIAPLATDTFDGETLHRLMADALDFPIPLVQLNDRLYVLELFHGPTLAFKDIGARTMARWLAAVSPAGSEQPLTVLVATSGDTGGAVAQAFHGVRGTRVVVLYPHGRVSRVQEAQFTTLGGNVSAVAVEGTFDDCQRLVKEAFADRDLHRAHRLTSANSINIGRLLPQMAYYAWAVARLPAGAAPVVVVPSGNLGNLTAGVLAGRRGVPIRRFVAATTINDPFPRYLASGVYEPHPAVPTLASAMDVGHPSNLERLTWLFAGDIGRMRQAIDGARFTDPEIRGAMRELADRFAYVADPHTAVAYLGATRATPAAEAPVVLLATAHPAKFPEVVAPTLGRAVPAAAALTDRLALPVQATRIAPALAPLAAVLRNEA
jgi:threonine synthase